jgi:hypothetical protein
VGSHCEPDAVDHGVGPCGGGDAELARGLEELTESWRVL